MHAKFDNPHCGAGLPDLQPTPGADASAVAALRARCPRHQRPPLHGAPTLAARAGATVTDTVSFEEKIEARVARIDPASIMMAARAVATGTKAISLSCTNLRTLDIIGPLKAELGIPVLSSNQVLAWHMARTTDAQLATDAPGCLCRIPLV